MLERVDKLRIQARCTYRGIYSGGWGGSEHRLKNAPLCSTKVKNLKMEMTGKLWGDMIVFENDWIAIKPVNNLITNSKAEGIYQPRFLYLYLVYLFLGMNLRTVSNYTFGKLTFLWCLTRTDQKNRLAKEMYKQSANNTNSTPLTFQPTDLPTW